MVFITDVFLDISQIFKEFVVFEPLNYCTEETIEFDNRSHLQDLQFLLSTNQEK